MRCKQCGRPTNHILTDIDGLRLYKCSKCRQVQTNTHLVCNIGDTFAYVTNNKVETYRVERR